MKSSKAGVILLLISGILTIMISFVFLVIAAAIPYLSINTSNNNSSIILAVVFLLIFMAVFILGIIKLWASRLMKNPKTTVKGGIIALIVGILTSDILALIGGIIGIVQGE